MRLTTENNYPDEKNKIYGTVFRFIGQSDWRLQDS